MLQDVGVLVISIYLVEFLADERDGLLHDEQKDVADVLDGERGRDAGLVGAHAE